MDPNSVQPFSTMQLVRGSVDVVPSASNSVVGEVLPSPDLRRFTLDPRLSPNKEVRHAPRVAPLGEGFVALWADASRNLGQDVFLRVLGPGFDEGLEEPDDEER